MKKISLIAALALLTPTFAFAFFCPTNFSQIDFGMTVDQVTQACGKPDKQDESTQANDNIPQEWTYYISQTVNMGGSNQNAQGTLKSSVAFDDKGKVINISVNGIGVGATPLCGSSIKLGDDKDSVKAACGDPSIVNKEQAKGSNGAAAAAQDTKIILMNYTSVTPPVTLVFENGKLTDKK